MTITDIDPFRYKLIFERFLNPERVSMPDFDIDLCFEGRQDVIEYTRQKYGDPQVGHIVTFGTLKAKAVIKDVGRVLNIPLSEVNMLTKLIPEGPKVHLSDAFNPPTEKYPDGGQLAQYREDPRYKELFDLCFKLEDINRNTSLHASGIVIGKSELPEWAPVYKDGKTGKVAVQYTMDIIEPCGLVKMDYLGLKTLSLIRYAENIINKHKKSGEPLFRADQVSETDAETFELFSRGDTVAVFQFESPGMQKILRQAKPHRLGGLVASNALFRPGATGHSVCAWPALGGAIISEVSATLALRQALNQPGFYVMVGIGYALAFILLSLTLKAGMPLGVAYGIWSAGGVAVTAIASRFLFGEPLTRTMVAGIALIMAGVLLVELGSAH